VFVLSLVVFASCFRLYGLTFQSMWLDELLSINHSAPNKGIIEPIRYGISRDGSPPLFNMLLWIWRLAFGTGEYSARALPVRNPWRIEHVFPGAGVVFYKNRDLCISFNGSPSLPYLLFPRGEALFVPLSLECPFLLFAP
jgi:hypothetical protein